MSKRGRPAASLLGIGDTDTSRPEQEPRVEQPEPVAIWQKHWRPGRAGTWEDEDEARCKTLAGQYSNEWEIRVVYTAPPEPTDRMRGALYKIERMTRDFPGGDRRLKKMGDIARTALATTEEEE